MSLTSMNTAYRRRLDNRDALVRARIRAGEAMVRLIERHPEMAERYTRLYDHEYGGEKRQPC